MYKLILVPVFILLQFVSQLACAESSGNWSHKSEASVVQVDGNTASESYSLKQKTDYKFDLDLFTLKGRYLQTKTQGVESALQWEASLRWEREFTDRWSLFHQHGAEIT
ncbi:MAG: DUF481 domain-containing protein [Bdellovibrionaceae bacterium]|nr:DUF481 domain-containing protein [Pseudobdellovibrionaceae bacterium]